MNVKNFLTHSLYISSGYCVKSLAPSVNIFIISKLCVVKNVIPAFSINNAEYNIKVQIIINAKVIRISALNSSGFLTSRYINNIIAIIHLPILSNEISVPNTCNIIFRGLTKILSNSPSPK